MDKIAGIFGVTVVAFGLVWPQVAVGVEISKVREGKLAAFSFTYDDAARSHYDVALPLHLKYRMPATFLVITDCADAETTNPTGKYCTWPQLKEMAARGMEIASHTKTHRNMRGIESAGITKEMTKGKSRDELFAMREKNWPELWSEIELSKKDLEEHTGQPVRTYAFGGNACPDWTGRLMAKARGYVRAGNIRIATGRGDTEDRYVKLLDEKVMVSNRVSCAMVHGVGTGLPNDGWNPMATNVYETLLKQVAARRDRLYVDTYGNNAAYEARANATRLVQDKTHPDTYKVEFAAKSRSVCEPGEIWLRLVPGESVSVRGKTLVPNADRAVCVQTGDTIVVGTIGGSCQSTISRFP